MLLLLLLMVIEWKKPILMLTKYNCLYVCFTTGENDIFCSYITIDWKAIWFSFILREQKFSQLQLNRAFYEGVNWLLTIVTTRLNPAKFNYQRILNDKLIARCETIPFRRHQQLTYILKSVIQEIIVFYRFSFELHASQMLITIHFLDGIYLLVSFMLTLSLLINQLLFSSSSTFFMELNCLLFRIIYHMNVSQFADVVGFQSAANISRNNISGITLIWCPYHLSTCDFPCTCFNRQHRMCVCVCYIFVFISHWCATPEHSSFRILSDSHRKSMMLMCICLRTLFLLSAHFVSFQLCEQVLCLFTIFPLLIKWNLKCKPTFRDCYIIFVVAWVLAPCREEATISIPIPMPIQCNSNGNGETE